MRTYLARRLAALCSLVATVVAAPLAVAQQSPAEGKPIAVVALASLDQWLKEIDFIGGLMGAPQASQMVTAQINQMTANQGLPGIGLDGARAFGIVVQPGAMSPSFALCLPVTDQAALLSHLQAAGLATSQDMGGGVQQIKVGPMGWDVYAKNAGGWTMLSMAPALMEGLPADPGPLFAALTADYDVAVQVNVQSLPAPLRQMALEQISAAAKRGAARRPNESDEKFAARQKVVEEQLAQGQQMLEQLDQFTLGLSLDGPQQRVFVDVSNTALPGSALAADIASAAQATTSFAGFMRHDAAAAVGLAGQAKSSSLSSMDMVLDAVRQAIGAGIAEQVKGPAAAQVQAAFNDILDAFAETIEAGALDGGATLTATPESLTLVAGGLIADPAKIEAALKKLTDAAAADASAELPTVQMAAATHGGVTFHTLSLPASADMKPLLGEKLDVVVGVGSKAAYLALGRGAQAALQQAIDASAAEPNKAIPPMELTASVGQILNAVASVADAESQQIVQMIAGMVTGGGSGSDQVHVIAEPIPNGMRTRIAVHGGVLQAAGMAALMGQMQGAPGPQPAGAFPQ